MKKMSEAYGSVLSELFDSFPVQRQETISFKEDTPTALEVQKRRVEALRRQCEGVGFDAQELESEDIAALATGPCVQLVDINDIAQGPAHVALQLCTTAELNEDQMRAVALVAKPLQETCDKRLARSRTGRPRALRSKTPCAPAGL